MWHPITNQADVDNLMKAFGSFHDGCIREAYVWGGYCVAPDLKMTCPQTPDLKCRLIIQRQWNNPAVIELLFGQVSQISIVAPAGYDRIITAATLLIEEQRIIWSPDYDYEESSHDATMSSAIVSARLWWRPIADGLGSTLKYMQASELPGGFAL